MRAAFLLLVAGCGGVSLEAPPPDPQPPPAALGYPDLAAWGPAVASVPDPEQGELRTLHRSPDGQAWAKVHHPPGQPEIILGIDVRRRGDDGWRYERWDPARRRPLEVDVETCRLCHSMAPQDETYTR